MLFQDDPTEQKPDVDTLEQQLTNSNENESGSESFSHEPEEDSSESKGIKVEKDEEDDGLDEPAFPDSANGHQHSPKNGDADDNESSGDFNLRIESVGTVDGQSPDITIRMNQLEKEVTSLECLLMSKEMEWNAILRLKKLKELLMEQLRREGDISNIMSPSEGKDLNSLAKECMMLDDKSIEKLDHETKSFTTNIKNEISKMEVEITEIRGNRYQRVGQKPTLPLSLEHRNASLALRQLSEKNSAELRQGRNGPIVPVTTLIADYRAKRKQESPLVTRKRTRIAKPISQPSSSISYSDVLVSLAKISSSENKAPDIPVNSTSTPTSTPKAISRGGNASVATAKSNITLAKLLSTSGATGTSGSHRSDDNKPAGDDYKSRHFNNSGSNPDTSISLSNLLASNNKGRNDSSQKAESIPICQGCNRNQAQFVCAGCGSQWYCSRECQVDAWDDHAESCSG